jgi:glycogen debranching enzyme
MVARPVAGETALAWADGRFAGDARLGPGECATWALGISREPPALPQSAVQYTAAVPRPPVAPRLTSPNSAVAKAWETAVADLASLPLGLESAPYALAAGVPLYVHFFGRDTLTAGWQALLAAPEYLRDALVANAALQGEQTDDWLDEQPGKMIHEVRTGPLSLLGNDPLLRYYGDYATPPDFVAMLAQYWTWTADTATVRKLLPAAWRALDWLERDGDLDGDGFLEYVTRSSAGVKNQGWKDAPESVVDDAGKIAANPLATSELQGYWYAALQLGALLAAVVSRDFLYAARLGARARRLRRQFNKQFWLEDEGHYALALDREKRPIRAAGSNDAHLLVTGIVPRERARRLVNRLFEPDIFTGWGIRTLSSDHPAYNPFSYHRGSVWPVEHGTFALGLARYGFWDELGLLARAVFDAAALCPEHRLPEVLGGLQRDGNDSLPGVYPNACSPQAWSASTVVMLVQALLGLNPAAPLAAAFVDPHLPAWLPNLRLDGVRIGAATVDLQAWRTSSGTTSFRVTRRDGRLAVLRQPPPNDPRGKLFRRLAGLVPHR